VAQVADLPNNRGPAVEQQMTDQVRQVLRFAQEEAKDLYSEYLGTEHLLLGLLREETGIAARLLRARGIDLRRLRREAGDLVPLNQVCVVEGPRPVTPMAQEVLDRARVEARNLPQIDTGHLLLGLLYNGESQAAHLLTSVGLHLEEVRRDVLGVLWQGVRVGEGSIYDERSAVRPAAADQVRSGGPVQPP
jgi:ATP-dependent Clp protease ATP-binding subunit ClpC